MKAYELIADPKNWAGSPSDPEVSRWTILGALIGCYGDSPMFEYAYSRCLNLCGRMSVSFWEAMPMRTHAEVIALLKQAEG